MKLYEITEELLAVEDSIIEAGGEIDEETESALENMEGAFADKVDNICGLIDKLDNYAEAARSRARELSKLARSRESAVENLKNYLLFQLRKADRDDVETPLRKVYRSRNGRPKVRAVDEVDELPGRFVKRKTSVSVDSNAIYDALREAEAIPSEVGDHVVEINGVRVAVSVGEHVRIK